MRLRPHLPHLLPRRWADVNTRGQILIVYGVIYVAIGANILQQPDPPGWEHLPIIPQMPRELRASLWLLTGSLAIAFAWRPSWITHDGLGFLSLYVMPAERVVIFLWGWLDYLCPPVNVCGWFVLFGGPGYPRGLYSAFVYLAIVAAVLVNANSPAAPNRYTRKRNGLEQ